MSVIESYSKERKEQICLVIQIVKDNPNIIKKDIYKQLQCSPKMKSLAFTDALKTGSIYESGVDCYQVWKYADITIATLKR